MVKGIVRKIDDLGRITLPIEYRRMTGIEVLQPLDLYTENGVLRLRRGKGRRMDELGRYCIPKEIRRSNKWAIGQALDIYVDDGEICIGKIGCFICGSTEGLEEIDGFHICRNHVLKIAEKAYES